MFIKLFHYELQRSNMALCFALAAKIVSVSAGSVREGNRRAKLLAR